MSQERIDDKTRKNQVESEVYTSHQIKTNMELKIPEKVCIVHGANQVYFNLSGLTVSEVKDKLRDVINVASSAEAHVEGKLVDDSYTLQGGEYLEFVKETGTKG